MTEPFTVISTFSGCGGSSLGYKLAGGKVLLAVEWEDNAVKTYKANHPTTKVYHGDIGKLMVDDVLELTGLKVGELDIFDGSPPCQGFSMTGKRNSNDSRNQLFREYVRLLQGLKPKVFVMENVAGMVKGNMKFLFVEILKELKSCGYNVKAKILNAKNYQVPQSRERMIFIGVREDLHIEPSHPIGSSKLITVREAFKDCPESERKKPSGINLQYMDLCKPGEQISKYHPKGHGFSSNRLSWVKPSPTIIKSFGTSRGMVFHPELNESISITEVKRLFTFPDDYIFLGSFVEQWARLGNCVPPNLMKAIAIHIKENILNKVAV